MKEDAKHLRNLPEMMTGQQARARLFLHFFRISLEQCKDERNARQAALEFLKQYPDFVNQPGNTKKLN